MNKHESFFFSKERKFFTKMKLAADTDSDSSSRFKLFVQKVKYLSRTAFKWTSKIEWTLDKPFCYMLQKKNQRYNVSSHVKTNGNIKVVETSDFLENSNLSIFDNLDRFKRDSKIEWTLD